MGEDNAMIIDKNVTLSEEDVMTAIFDYMAKSNVDINAFDNKVDMTYWDGSSGQNIPIKSMSVRWKSKT